MTLNPQDKKLVDPATFDNPLCAKISPIHFYVDEDDEIVRPEVSNKSYDTAIETCKKCSHATDCAEWGIKKEKWGVWGGLTPQERVKIRRRRKISLRDSK